jgi:hypothetical protein
MAGRGGYQPPAHPAAVSGPGRLSRRTDGGPAQQLRHLPDAQYGEDATYTAQQRSAPLAQVNPAPAAAAASGGQQSAVGFGDPSTRPGEPVTAGAASGPGPGPEALTPALSPAGSYGTLTDLLSGLAGGDMTGSMAKLSLQAMQFGLGR